MNSYRNYNNNTSMINKNLEKLSSGYAINRAGDNAAGLAISEKMRAQITGLEVAQKNAKDGISLVQTAEGALTEVHSMLNRMFELAEQSANGTYDTTLDRSQLQKEVVALRTEINRIRDSSNFNGQKLLNGDLNGCSVEGNSSITDVSATFTNAATDEVKAELFKGTYTVTLAAGENGGLAGSVTGLPDGWSLQNNGFTVAANATSASFTIIGPADENSGESPSYATVTLTLDEPAAGTATLKLGEGNALQLQIGDTGDSFNQMKVNVGDIQDKALGIDSIDISTVDGATGALDLIKTAINTVSDIRGGLGAIQNRLEHTINNLSVMQENMQDAESTVRDTDVASEMMKYTKNSILVQSAQAMLAQANQQPQGVLQLLQ